MYNIWFSLSYFTLYTVPRSIHVSVLCLVAQSCPTPCDPMDCSPPGSSIYGIFQARVLEWVAIAFSTSTTWKPKVAKNNKCWWRYKEIEALFLWMKSDAATTTMENSLVFPQKTKQTNKQKPSRFPNDPTIPLWGMFPKELKIENRVSKRYLYTCS